ncbi:hypothetical protein D9619_003049 [Psilocybe cf. subviscida]|uniref:DNA mismatch repair proteins mutS family domain-containing protein n=1 Tax=Psilocybe cf. subviscida TaxID=2480587 RepID=A0A8H5AXD4_9AGAR|nr:hypothetical protein D9619_003049 [Psilocybe cf. subviscida]
MVLTRLHRNARFLPPFKQTQFVSPAVRRASSVHDTNHSEHKEGPVKAKKSRKTSKKLSDLPVSFSQLATNEPLVSTTNDSETRTVANDTSVLHSSALPDIVEYNPVSKVVKRSTLQQVEENLKRFPHCLLLTRVGQFYESYFGQAQEIAELLNIKLASKKWGGERIAMAGFPLIHLDKHLKTLVQKEQRFVALCEEFQSTSSTTKAKVFERRVARIVTPGTLIDESWLDPSDTNYLLAVSMQTPNGEGAVGLAWTDVSTGEFFSTNCDFENIEDELARLRPREVVLDHTVKTLPAHPILAILKNKGFAISYASKPDAFPHPNQGQSHAVPPESEAVGLLTLFLQQHLMEYMPLLDTPAHESSQEVMHIDSHTIRGLEIRETYEGSAKGSLFSVVKRTTTNGGARLLTRWLCSPSTSIPEITARQNLVSLFKNRPHFHRDVNEIMKGMADARRICQSFHVGRAGLNDLVSLYTTIEAWTTLLRRIAQERSMESIENTSRRSSDWESLDGLISRMSDLQSLSQKIFGAIESESEPIVSGDATDPDVEEPLLQECEVETEVSGDKSGSSKWRIKPSYSDALTALHNSHDELLAQKDILEEKLQTDYDAMSLTLRSSPGQGFFVHLSRSKRDKSNLERENSDFHSIGESASTKSYFYKVVLHLFVSLSCGLTRDERQPWSDLGNSIVDASAAIVTAEKLIFDSLCGEIIENSNQLQQNAQVIDELDVVMSFATLANEMSFVKPEMTDDGSYVIANGRHPTVEMGLLASGRQFVPNSVDMSDSSNMHIITGPNMAGKSTLLRQTALTVILAQVGSFVPADSAKIGVVDKLFSRIGARDDLFRDRSTFMVEMLETADILRRASKKSLVIMDEVGRGTTVNDGLAISFATLHHLATVNGSRCFFATHFHEVAEMIGNEDGLRGSGVFDRIRFYCSDIDESDDQYFTYSYRLRPGINRDSHGLRVARIAGVPSAALNVASDTLAWLKNRDNNRTDTNFDSFARYTVRSTN